MSHGHGHRQRGRPTGTTDVATTLPTPLTRVVGREAELAQAPTQVAEARLMTLPRPGGAGAERFTERADGAQRSTGEAIAYAAPRYQRTDFERLRDTA